MRSNFETQCKYLLFTSSELVQIYLLLCKKKGHKIKTTMYYLTAQIREALLYVIIKSLQM